MDRTPLENWISEKTEISGRPEPALLREYQLDALGETLRLVREKSRFYRKQLADFSPGSIRSLEDLSHLPFTTPADIAVCPEDFLCVAPRDIGRIVTLSTSGTTGPPKRLFFTGADQELTIDFFHHGMTTMAEPGDRVMIFMPGTAPGSIGDLLKKGLARFNSDGVVYGPIRDYADALNALIREKISVLVGIPSQILRLARYSAHTGKKPALKSALLSADYVPISVTRAVEETWNCGIYGHYGMTETGLGGGVECAARDGYHLREADLLFEIIDPKTEQPVPDGTPGEVVFTTLTRRGMPLVRYRTGDTARFLTEPCPCGSILRRMGRVTGRISGVLPLKDGGTLSITQLDEFIYAHPSVLAYAAELTAENGGARLLITVDTVEGDTFDEKTLYNEITVLVGRPVTDGRLALEIRRSGVDFYTSGTLKRRISDYRSKY